MRTCLHLLSITRSNTHMSLSDLHLPPWEDVIHLTLRCTRCIATFNVVHKRRQHALAATRDDGKLRCEHGSTPAQDVLNTASPEAFAGSGAVATTIAASAVAAVEKHRSMLLANSTSTALPVPFGFDPWTTRVFMSGTMTASYNGCGHKLMHIYKQLVCCRRCASHTCRTRAATPTVRSRTRVVGTATPDIDRISCLREATLLPACLGNVAIA